MKTRIKVIEKNSGENLYYIQYRKLSYSDLFSCIVLPILWVGIPVVLAESWRDIDKTTYYDLESAKKAIDDYIGKKIKSVTYIKHP